MIENKLRQWVETVRREPYRLAESVPMVRQAADEIEALRARVAELEEAAKRALIIEGIASRNCEHARLLKISKAREEKLSKALNNGGWISVFDELPSDGQQVLVWEDLTLYSTGRSFKGCSLYYWRDGIGWVANSDDDDAYPMICIQHWKPLPAPPAIDAALEQQKEGV